MLPIEFFIFGLTLLGVAVLHHHSLKVALGGLLTLIIYKTIAQDFHLFPHLGHEWVVLTNLLGLLLGFAILADHFEKSHVALLLPKYLPDDWKGGFFLLVIVFVLSSFLDNIAAAMIGGAMAMSLFNKRVHIGYLAAIVAASNAGGSGSVVGDTTTTMMWIAGKSPSDVFHAYAGAIVALIFFGIFAAKQQHRYQPIMKDNPTDVRIEWQRLGIVAIILFSAITANVLANLYASELLDHLPILGIAVWIAIIATRRIAPPTWGLLPEAGKGAAFLLSLVLCASMMPIEHLPSPSALSTFGLGAISSVFDNIPLTALAINQGGYDWGFLAYAVGFGGSMTWFGSSAGVALTGMFPEGRDVRQWVTAGWHVTVAYVIGYIALMLLVGWHPHWPDSDSIKLLREKQRIDSIFVKKHLR